MVNSPQLFSYPVLDSHPTNVGTGFAAVYFLSTDNAQYMKIGANAPVFMWEPKQVFQGLDAGTAFTSTATVNSLAFTQDVAVNAGTYKIQVSGMMNSDATGSDGIIHADFDGQNLSAVSSVIFRKEQKDIAGDSPAGTASAQHIPFLKEITRDLTAGTKTFNLFTDSEAAGVETSVWDIVLTVERIA